jgi:putative ABC transport system permease protein
VVSLLTGVLAGIIPAVRGLRARLYEVLKAGGRVASEGAGATWLRDGLVIAEVALSLALLVGAALLVQSFVRLRGVDKGFKAENVVTLRVRLPLKFQQTAQRSAAFADLEQRLRSLPGVESVAFTSDIPIGADWQGTDFTIEGEPPLATGEERQINWAIITPGYLRTMGIQLVHGRNITEQDRQDAPKVLLINEAMARQYFPDTDPIGKRIFAGFSTQFAREIVGIVKDLKHADLQSTPTANVFVPVQQMNPGSTLSLLLLSNTQPAALFNPARQEIQNFDRGITVYQIRTMQEVIAGSIALPRFAMLLAGLFAAIAALLAAVGIYGVVSYTISQHTHEIGVRMALGAQSRDILKLVIGQGMRPALIGIVIGVAASLALTRIMSNLLFGVHAVDVTTFAVTAVALAGVALLACWVPARRATRFEPLIALRYE